MCFRPAAIEKNCPECGAIVGSFDTECPECGASIASNAPFAAPGMPGAPGMPSAPGMPGVPPVPGQKA